MPLGIRRGIKARIISRGLASGRSAPIVMQLYAVRNYSFVFPFEDGFEMSRIRGWVDGYWTSCFFFAAIYLAAIPLGRRWMSSRARYELRGPLVCWNVFLAVFSMIGAVRTIPEIVHVTKNIGLYYSVCDPSYILDDKVAGLWSVLFVLSKLPELGDTLFIVLRKQPLMFLHWYHHATVLMYSWYALAENNASARWFVTMNYTIHSAMYSYFALKALRIRVPKFVSMTITLAQLVQMVVGCAVNILAYQWKAEGKPCQVSSLNIKLSFLMYFSYFVLFIHFFYNSYFVAAGQGGHHRLDVNSNGISAKGKEEAKKLQ